MQCKKKKKVGITFLG